MEHDRVGPSASLAPFIAHFWWVRWDLRGQPPFTAETLPHPCVHILFELGRAMVAGVPTSRFARTLKGQDRVFGIKFRPAAFQPVLGAPLSSLTSRVVSLRSVVGRRADEVRRAILNEEDPQRCVLLAEQFLGDILPSMPPQVAQLRDLVERMSTDATIRRAEDAAAAAGLELRTLQRRFKAAVGVTPKWVIQRYRLHEAAQQLALPHPPDLASLALQLGYFDQPHFIRDFKAVVGKSPGQYLAEAAP
jgi:AraC-like DNA-binding protein